VVQVAVCLQLASAGSSTESVRFSGVLAALGRFASCACSVPGLQQLLA